ncbi:N-acetyltransferase [uncultured Clostridium sp.]|uniref:GNAT family N-acetyltransferase n=1 Tax=uncultured Clostridium sp. TaxID=59620 RepID=UPI002637CC03|nr:N-acetyltransferase [uncultured Clostridium sp.]
MVINVRNEMVNDYEKVELITREAFWNLYFPGCNEHLIIHNLRKHEDFIKELAFVIEVDGTVIGSIHYSKSKVISSNGQEHETITFAPVSILPSLHGKGFGKILIQHSIAAAKDLGYKGIVIGGYPSYYKKYGFIGSKKYEISLSDGNFYTGIMALPLYENALNNINGVIHFSETMEPDEDALNEFDMKFPHKEKEDCESQLQFQKAVSELDLNIY